MSPQAASDGGDGTAGTGRRVLRFLGGIEDLVTAAVLLGLVALPVGELVARQLGTGIPGSGPLVQHLALVIAFTGAALAAREGKLLALATGQFLPEGVLRRVAGGLAAAVGTFVTVLLADASWQLVGIEREFGTTFASDWPVWVPLSVVPISFALIAARLVWRAGSGLPEKLAAAAGAVAGVLLARALRADELLLEGTARWPWLAGLAVATVLGGPLYVAIGGAALFLFLGSGISSMALPTEAYRMAASPHLPAIPLFTLAGFLLGEGAAPKRLLHVFQQWMGWMPGGTAIVCAVLCAFLTVLTGGSGVTILVAGGILFTALVEDGYPERPSLGLLTASGSLGLLLPPALPLILYGIVAQVPIEQLFLGGLLPGVLLIAMIAAWGMRQAVRAGVPRRPFVPREAFAALHEAKFELLLPVVVLGALFSGVATLLESAALTALYALVVQVFVQRDVSVRKDLLRVLRECGVLVGGVLLILGVAMGLTSWLVDAQVPTRLVEWAQTHVESKLAFLLGLNVFLLIVGCLMDVFSATVVVVPLIVPLGEAFGIHPVHLGIIFIANLELGYLTPPVGLNLFLASYRFERPLLTIYRAALPLLLVLGIGVLVITYVPGLTTWLLE